MEPEVSEPIAKGTRPAATAAPEPLEEPPDQRVRSHGFRPGPVKRGGGETVAAAAGEFHHGEFAGEHGARAGELVDDRGVVIEDLAGVGLGAPGGGLSGEGEQILDAVGDALQGAAIAFAL